MRHSNATNNNQGFTILEILTVVVIVGILAAFSAPNFLAWNHRKQIDSAITGVEGAIKEAQREAIAKSKSCNVSITPVASTPAKVTVSSTNNCLTTGTRTLERVSLPASSTITFDHLGQSSAEVTLILTHVNNSNLKRCLVVSTPLGLIGKGENPSSGVCNP